MSTKHLPAIGQWYLDRDSGALFEVVAWDGDSGLAEVQYLDGELAEYDMDTWEDLELAPAAAPEDWTSAYELNAEDRLDPDLPMHPDDWTSPLNRIEPDTVVGFDD